MNLTWDQRTGIKIKTMKERELIIDENKVLIKYEVEGNEVLIHRINGICNIEIVFRQRFIDECYEAVEVLEVEEKAEAKEYLGEMKSDESRFN